MIYTDKTKKAMLLMKEAYDGMTDVSSLPAMLYPWSVASMMPDEKTTIAALLHNMPECGGISAIYATDDRDVLHALDVLREREGESLSDYLARILDNRIAVLVS